tara:strand:+ start:799 stop:1890 length:1092 start_codon:yes stop_codon:yes gene_type:complete
MEFLAGNRIRGTSAEKPVLGLPSGSVGGWKELKRVKGSVPDITSLPNKKYYMVLGHHIQGSGNTGIGMQLNGDTTAGHYPRRYTDDGTGTDATPTTETNMFIDTNGSTVTGKEWFTVMYISNETTKEKIGLYNTSSNRGGTTASTTPYRITGTWKWTDTSNSIDRINFSDFNGTACNANSEVVVLGWDTTDTHTDNFWEELVSVTQASDAATLDTQTFTPKKYMWMQIFGDSSNNLSPSITFNGETAGATNDKYTLRNQHNGSADDTSEVNIEWIALNQGGSASHNEYFSNIFFLNDSSYEKLIHVNTVENDTSGTSGIPSRTNVWGKWTDVLTQINRITLAFRDGGSGNVLAGTTIKVWGHD